MKSKPSIARREFLKLTGAGAAASFLCKLQSTPRFSWFAPQSAGQSLSGARLPGPLIRSRRGSGELQSITWDAAIAQAADRLRNVPPERVVCLLGLFPDHLFHMAHAFAAALGGARLLRYSPRRDLEGQAALLEASQLLFGSPRLPVFDIFQADRIFSFGASLAESWLSPYADYPAAGAGAKMLESVFFSERKRPYWVQFAARRSPAGSAADEWIPIRLGSEARLAQVLQGLATGSLPAIAVENAASSIGVDSRELRRLARLFALPGRSLALPGGAALSGLAGLAAAQSILALNLVLPDHEPAFFFAPGSALYPELPGRAIRAAELAALFEQMRAGQVQALLVHGVDPLACLPRSCQPGEAFANIETVISFSPYQNATALESDLLLPTHSASEMWGYQIPPARADYGLVSAILPQAASQVDSRSSGDVLLGIGRGLGLEWAESYRDEQDFLRRSLAGLSRQGGDVSAADPVEFYRLWQAQGGWQRAHPARFPALPTALFDRLALNWDAPPASPSEETLQLLIYPAAGDSSCPLAAEIHPLTARRLNLKPGEVVRVTTQAAEMSLPLVLNHALHPQTLALAWDPDLMQAPNPLDLIGNRQTDSGSLVYSGLPIGVQRQSGN